MGGWMDGLACLPCCFGVRSLAPDGELLDDITWRVDVNSSSISGNIGAEDMNYSRWEMGGLVSLIDPNILVNCVGGGSAFGISGNASGGHLGRGVQAGNLLKTVQAQILQATSLCTVEMVGL